MSKPKTLQCDPQQFPKQLFRFKQWVGWKLEKNKKGEWTKPPYMLTEPHTY
jgi:hypothetical protein